MFRNCGQLLLCVTLAGAVSPISSDMINPYAHDPDCAFWFDHYESGCTCSRPDQKPPAADPAQEMSLFLDRAN
jgi:hypothetical protein